MAYGGTPCPDFRKGSCRRGDACEYAHGVFEAWLHPLRYRTMPCKDGTACTRRVCFFAHTSAELRLPTPGCGGGGEEHALVPRSGDSGAATPPSSSELGTWGGGSCPGSSLELGPVSCERDGCSTGRSSLCSSHGDSSLEALAAASAAAGAAWASRDGWVASASSVSVSAGGSSAADYSMPGTPAELRKGGSAAHRHAALPEGLQCGPPSSSAATASGSLYPSLCGALAALPVGRNGTVPLAIPQQQQQQHLAARVAPAVPMHRTASWISSILAAAKAALGVESGASAGNSSSGVRASYAAGGMPRPSSFLHLSWIEGVVDDFDATPICIKHKA